METADLQKHARYLKRCKDVIWQRRTDEYEGNSRAALPKHVGKPDAIAVGDVMMIKEDERNQWKWKIGIMDKLVIRRDDIVRAAKLQAGNAYLYQALQQLYPLVLACDR